MPKRDCEALKRYWAFGTPHHSRLPRFLKKPIRHRFPHHQALEEFHRLVEETHLAPELQWLYCQDCGELLYASPESGKQGTGPIDVAPLATTEVEP